MMGLLDIINSTDPATQNGLLNFGLSLLQSKGNFGNAFGRAGQAAQIGARDFRQQEELLKRAGLNDQLLQMQLDQARQQADQQRKLQELATQYSRSPQQQAMAQNGGPTVAAANAVPTTAPGFDYQGFAGALPAVAGPVAALQFQQMLRKDQPQLQAVEPDKELGYLGPDNKWVSVVKGAPKADKPNPNQPFMMVDGKIVPNKAYQEYELEKASRSGTKITNSVNTGQKGYENESKLRNDFKSEPIYKDYQDMVSAYKQIKAGIAAGTPIGDVATATKIMKLLDPGSVVRESELGIAMSAGGRMDRLQNYVRMQMSGEKLTPTMRSDFGKLADELMSAAGQAYNAKRAEYEKMGSRYQLDPSVLGAPYSAEPLGWSIEKVK